MTPRLPPARLRPFAKVIQALTEKRKGKSEKEGSSNQKHDRGRAGQRRIRPTLTPPCELSKGPSNSRHELALVSRRGGSFPGERLSRADGAVASALSTSLSCT